MKMQVAVLSQWSKAGQTMTAGAYQQSDIEVHW